jgi:hypothetical protein
MWGQLEDGCILKDAEGITLTHCKAPPLVVSGRGILFKIEKNGCNRKKILRGQKAVTFLPKCKKVGRKMATDTKFAGVSFYLFYFNGEHPVEIVECTTRNVFSAVEHSHKYSFF